MIYPFFWFLKTYTFLLISYIFRNSITKNRQYRHSRQSFHFQKITGTLKINIFIWKLAVTFLNPYTSKNNTKIKFEIFLFNIFFSPKLGKTIFDLYKVKINIFLNFTSFVALKDQRIPSPCRRLQKPHTNFVCADFRVTVQIFWGPATKERGNIETLNFGIGVQQQFGTK